MSSSLTGRDEAEIALTDPEKASHAPPTRSPEAATAAVPGFYASWGRRFVAWAIDTALIVALSVAVTVIGISRADSVASALVSVVLLAALPPAYYVAFTGSARGQTPGKMALGIAVRHRASLGRLGYGRAFGRWLVTGIFWLLFAVPALIDVLWPLVDSEHRSWHDLVSGSVVIRL